MGRWAQAARRGSPVAEKALGEAPVMEAWTTQGPVYVANWSVGGSPLDTEFQSQYQDEGVWWEQETIMLAGSARSHVTSIEVEGFPGRGRARARWADGWSPWSDWSYATEE